jgi:transcriptional regulator
MSPRLVTIADRVRAGLTPARRERIAVTERKDIFGPRDSEQVLRLVLGNPLAWIVSLDAGAFRATPLPLRPRVGAESRIEALDGHFARSNPHSAALQRDGHAILLFTGPQGYISPSWVSDRTWGPTWNYAVVQFLVTIEFDETPARLDAHLHDLVGAMERGRPDAWHPAEMGARYETLKRMIVPFEARVLEQRARFKLGQDERDAVFGDITGALGRSGQDDLLAWMRELNPGR